VVMDGCVERVFVAGAGVEAVEHGVYVLRGDNIAAVGEVDAARDSEIAWSEVKVRCCKCPRERGERYGVCVAARVADFSLGSLCSLARPLACQCAPLDPVVH
jgi:hypothetical protein